jgi:pyridoxine/pyridoxamine 5'-phosphate oxidase
LFWSLFDVALLALAYWAGRRDGLREGAHYQRMVADVSAVLKPGAEE